MIELNLKLYEKMYLIRRAEEEIQKYYTEDEMKTPMHMSMGEEAIVSGICHALSHEDQVLGTYRSHGLYLAKTMETDKFFAEMYGRENGTSKGKAGSMHLIAPEHGLICTSAVVASHIPVAIGAAFANKQKNNGKIVASFFGDGAIDEGAFWESLNAACLMKLPIFLVCEDNGYAIHSPTSLRHGYNSISDIVRKFDCNVFESKSTDVVEIYKIASEALNLMKKNSKPCFMDFKYYRYLEHVGVFEDFNAGYRSRIKFEEWLKIDPLRLHRKKLIDMVPEDKIIAIERKIKDKVKKSLLQAKQAPFPKLKILCQGVLA